jgi:hypothetical protein
MFNPGFFRREKRKDQIDWLPVHGIEIDGFFQADEHTPDVFQTRDARMGQGNAVPHAGGAQRLSFHKRIHHRRRGQSVCGFREIGQIVNQAFLA